MRFVSSVYVTSKKKNENTKRENNNNTQVVFSQCGLNSDQNELCKPMLCCILSDIISNARRKLRSKYRIMLLGIQNNILIFSLNEKKTQQEC